jgi:branched-chain amino acid transport system permease protein
MADTLIAGIIHGNAYALVAVGLSLIFGVTHVVNFAQGSVFALGSMLGWWFIVEVGWPLWATVIGVMVLCGGVGLVINAIAVKPLSRVPPIAALLATFAVAMVLDNLSQIVFGPQTRPFPEVLRTDNFVMGGIRFGTSDVVMLAITIVSMVVLAGYLKVGKSGQAIRATAQDPDAARQMGVPVGRIQHLSFVIASGLGGLAGIFVGLYTSNISPTSGTSAGLTAFVAATLGGLGSMTGAVVGGFALGVIEALGVWFFGDGAHDLITFGLLIVVLLVRPAGLFGTLPPIPGEPMTGTFLGAGRPIRLRHWQIGLLLLVVAVAVPLLADGYTLTIGTQVLIFAIVAVPLTLVSGSAGQISLGQAGPIAVGAYSSALLVERAGWPFPVALLVAGMVSATVAAVLTAPIWRLRGHYVSIATLGVGIVIVAIIRNWTSLTRGAYGLSAIPPPRLFGLTVVTPLGFYLLDLAVLLITLGFVARVRGSHLGTVIASVGSDDTAARSAGIRARDYKALAFAVAAFFAGVAGSLMAHQYSYLDPTVFTLQMSTLALTILVLGGLSSPLGAVLGALVLVGAPELLRIAPDVRILLYGVLLIAVIRFRPQGVLVRSGAR